jgi:hypothetical protein
VPTPIRVVPLVLVLVAGLAGAACGGGDSKPKAGTPAATGVAPDCSVVPIEMASKALKLELTGPTAQTRPTGTACVFAGKTSTGRSSTETVLFNGNEDKASFAIVRDGYKENNIKVNKIGGWGDEAYAVRLMLFIPQNTFSVREGRVSVTITSAAEFEEVRALMKEILQKIS